MIDIIHALVEPVNPRTALGGIAFGSCLSAIMAQAREMEWRAISEFSLAEVGKLAGAAALGFFCVKREHFFDSVLIGTCWTVSRFITEKGALTIADYFFDLNDLRTKRKIEILAAETSSALSSFMAFGYVCLVDPLSPPD